jgi:hypothetical protein
MAEITRPKPYFQPAEDIVLNAASGNQVIMFGENHIYHPKNFIASVLPRLREMGFDALVTELEASYQRDMDEYLKTGRISGGLREYLRYWDNSDLAHAARENAFEVKTIGKNHDRKSTLARTDYTSFGRLMRAILGLKGRKSVLLYGDNHIQKNRHYYQSLGDYLNSLTGGRAFGICTDPIRFTEIALALGTEIPENQGFVVTDEMKPVQFGNPYSPKSLGIFDAVVNVIDPEKDAAFKNTGIYRSLVGNFDF